MKGLLYILLPIVAFVAMGNVENRQFLDVRLSPEDVTADSLRAICLSDSGNVYYNSGNYQDAIALETQALDIFKRLFGEYNLDYTKSLNNIALDYCYLGDYRKAVELGKKVVSINRQIVGEDSPDFSISLGNLALYYYYLFVLSIYVQKIASKDLPLLAFNLVRHHFQHPIGLMPYT